MIKEKKIAMIFPYAPAYRESIYTQMDDVFHVDWFFCGNARRPMKLLDYSILKHCDLSMQEICLWGSFRWFRNLRNLCFDDYDAIIIPSAIRNFSIWWLILHYKKEKRGPRLFFWTHGWYGKEKGLSKLLKKIFYSYVDGYFLYNKRAKLLMGEMGYDENKLFVIHNSLDYNTQLSIRNTLKQSDSFKDHFNNENKNLIFIGRLTKVKRFDLLIDAISILKERDLCVNVTFIGDGIERDNMVRMVEEKDLKNNVWFYGACYDEKKNAELIYNADLCVSPGNIGLTAMHVLMFGCPAITNDDYDHQMPEFEAIQEGISGAFFKAGDSYSLAETIDRWFTIHDSDREEVRKACYHEIDSRWNPKYQMSVLKMVFEKE